MEKNIENKEKILRVHEGTPILEADRVRDITDPKWCHPLLCDGWISGMGMGEFAKLYDPALSIEEKKAVLGNIDLSVYYPQTDNPTCEMKEYEVPGCPEEPETSAKVYVLTPFKKKGRKKWPVLFECVGGGMVFCEPTMCGLEALAEQYNCVVVSCKYRTALEAPYPAAINDLHATYKWMTEHADELNIDPDNVVIHGGSSGGHLALSIPFRLKRYGYSPKGIVAGNPITDDREIYPSSQICCETFDGEKLHTAYRMWLGYNFGSGRVGPEALANHATVEDCVGYPPVYIHTTEFDPDRDYNREFIGKVYAAGSFGEYHCWGGTHHGNYAAAPELNEIVQNLREGHIKMLFDQDLRRPWIVDEYKERILKKFEVKK